MSDRISRMANTNPANPTHELLAEIYEILKRHEQALLDLMLDAEGLKATLIRVDQDIFRKAREKARGESAFGADQHSRRYDSKIEQLRRA